jgi:hypothetical protein
MTEQPSSWYIVKYSDGHCDVVADRDRTVELPDNQSAPSWGPFSSQAEAIARRIGLIRSGKCRPR